MINIVIADDEPLALKELQSLIRENGGEFRIIGEYRNGRKVLDFLMDHPETDLAILDINMPGLTGLEIMEQRNRLNTPIDYIVVSAYSDYHLVRKAFKLGITDYIIKQELEKENLNPLLERVKERITRRKQRTAPNAPGGNPGYGEELRRFLSTGEWTGVPALPEEGKGVFRILKMEVLPCVWNGGEKTGDGILRLLSERAREDFSDCTGFREGEEFFLILHSESEEERGKISEFSEEIRREVKQFFNCTLVVSLSPEVSDLEILPEIYGKLKEIHSGKSKTVRRCLEHILEHYRDQEIRLEDLCNLTGTSRSYLSSLFKQETGLGFREYLNEVRIAHSISLLENGEMQIQEIAESAGFSNVEHFSRTFKNRTGVSPRRYQRGK